MSDSRRTAHFKALSFVVLAYALTAWVPWEPLQPIGGQMWAPGIAAVVVQLLFERRLSGLGWRGPNWRWWLAGLAFPLAYVALAYAAAWGSGTAAIRPDAMAWMREVLEVMIGFPSLPSWALLPLFAVALCTLGLVMNTIAALGEEIGWRGLLFPTLQRTLGFRAAALLSGAIWAVWHWNLILGGDYNAGADPAYSVAMFSTMIVLMSVGMGWLTMRSGSLWPAVMVHAGHNLFIQGAFEPLTVRPEHGQWITGEWGVAVPLAIAVVLLAAWARRRRGPAVAPSA